MVGIKNFILLFGIKGMMFSKLNYEIAVDLSNFPIEFVYMDKCRVAQSEIIKKIYFSIGLVVYELKSIFKKQKNMHKMNILK